MNLCIFGFSALGALLSAASTKLAWLVGCLCIGLAASANERVALVIGNAAYEHVPPLTNPRNDAQDMAGLLGRLGFAVTEGLDLAEDAMEDRIRAFARRAKAAEVALVFYAGHGMQVDGVNYLLPVDAQLKDEADLLFEAVALDIVLKSMGTGTNLVFLDACRDNPFARGWAGTGRSAAVGRGLTRVEGASASGMFIAFATDPDSVAADGESRNSPFTAALKRHIETPGLEVNSLLTEVRKTVLASTGNVQRPWSNSSLSAEFYFVPGSGAAPRIPTPTDPTTPDPAAEMWLQIRDTASVRTLERYLATYPDSRYRLAAEARLEELARQPFTVAVHPPGARVRVLNSGLPYEDGMLLPPGNYRIEASAGGHETKVEAVSHGNSPTSHRLVLTPTDGVFQDCEGCPEMVVIPSGVFRMGDLAGDADERAKPVRKVRIRRFAMGKYEVTVAQFRRFVLATGYRTSAEKGDKGCWTIEAEMRTDWDWTAGRNWRNLEYEQQGEQPVSCVSQIDARAYVDWLKDHTRLPYRLPSEAEWEYAARAGSETKYYFGDDIERFCVYGNVADQTPLIGTWRFNNRVKCSDGAGYPATVGSYQPNFFGLYDTFGNVSEWTADCWNDSYVGAPTDGRAWRKGKRNQHPRRGGGWNTDPTYRLAKRSWSGNAYRASYTGFRVTRTLAP